MYSLYLYSLGLSLKNTPKVLTIFKDEKRSYVSMLELDSKIWYFSNIQREKNVDFYNK
jgi:hypothetical protein